MGHIAGHGQGLEVNLRTHHRRADIEQYPPFQIADALGQNEEVGVGGLTAAGPIEVGDARG